MCVTSVNKKGDNKKSESNQPFLEVAGGTSTGALLANKKGDAFTSATTPKAAWPSGKDSDIKVRNVSAAGAEMSFDIGNGGPTGISGHTFANNNFHYRVATDKIFLMLPSKSYFKIEIYTLNGKRIFAKDGFYNGELYTLPNHLKIQNKSITFHKITTEHNTYIKTITISN